MKKDITSDFDLGEMIELTKKNEEITIRHEGKLMRQETIGYVYLVIDCSGSMAGEKLDGVKMGAKDFAIDAKARSYLVGLISFDSDATHLVEPQTNLSDLYRHIDSMSSKGSTNMTNAILLATEKLAERAGIRVMVIATDGMPDDEDSAIEAAQEAKKKGIEIIAIGTDDADKVFLKNLASQPFFGFKVSSNQLGQAIASVKKALLNPGRG